MKNIFVLILGLCISVPGSADSKTYYDKLMELWGDMTFDRRDNFMSQLKGVMHKNSDEGEAISSKEYESLLKMSKQEEIPYFRLVDKSGRPEDRSERRNMVQATCELFKGQPYKRCEKKWFEIVEFTSEDGDEISDSEWDQFVTLAKKLKNEKNNGK